MKKTTFLTVAFLIIGLFIISENAYATVYLSDHFDSQGTWDGCSSPPSPWAGYFYNSKHCNRVMIGGDWNDAHGSSGKSVKITWAASMMELSMATDQAKGKGLIWIGFWYKHNTGWNWGGDATQKWVYLPEVGGNRTMLSFVSGSLRWFDGNSYGVIATNHPNTSQSAWLNDDSWHKYVIYASPANNTLRVWRDGTEMTWNSDNYSLNYGGSSFGTAAGDHLCFGYQSRPDWASGNVSYFDDIIVASTQAEVESFLGGGSSGPVCGNGTKETGEACDEGGNNGVCPKNCSAACTVNNCSDTQKPVVSAFSIPSTSSSLIVPVTAYAATDNIGVTGYLITESSSVPSLSDPYWSSSPLASYQFFSEGAKTLYAWAKDAAGNISTSLNDSVTITLSSSGTSGLPFSDGFESGSFSSWDGSSGPIAVYNSGCRSGSRCSRATITSGSDSTAYADYYFGQKEGKDPVDELTMTTYVKFDSIASWPVYAHKITNLNIYDGNGDQSYQVLLGVAGSNSGKAGQYYIENTYWKDWEFFGRYQNQGTPASVANGQWDKLTVYAKLNTPGSSNGIIKLYVNDVLKLSYNNLNIRENTTDTFGKMVMTSMANSAATDSGYEMWDDYRLEAGDHAPTTLPQTCQDGTSDNACSATKPKYCLNGTLINKCLTCGCPTGQTCTNYQCVSQTKPGDLNADGKVDVIDLGIFLSNWGKTTKPASDLNQDGRVDVIDLGILLGNWG